MPQQNDSPGRDAAVEQGVEGRFGIGIHGGLGGNAGAHAEPAIVDAEYAEPRRAEHLAVSQLVGGESGSGVAVQE